MSYNANIPNSAQSPGIFPTQSGTNFSRLQTIINNDHIFNASVQANDGTHKQVTLTDRAVPVSLPTGTNSILYSWLDGTGASQLRFYNGAIDQQMTPYDLILPERSAGSASVPSNNTVDIFNKAYDWMGTGIVAYLSGSGGSTLNTRTYRLIRLGSVTSAREIDESNLRQGSNTPSFEFSGTILKVRNNDGSTRILYWAVIVDRIA